MSNRSYQGYCPLHEWSIAECAAECAERKAEMHRINRDLCSLWYARERGALPDGNKATRWQRKAA